MQRRKPFDVIKKKRTNARRHLMGEKLLHDCTGRTSGHKITNRSRSISFRCKRSHRDFIGLSWLKIVQSYPSRIVHGHTACNIRKRIIGSLSEEHSVPQQAAIVILRRKGVPLYCHTNRCYISNKDTWCTAGN